MFSCKKEDDIETLQNVKIHIVANYYELSLNKSIISIGSIIGDHFLTIDDDDVISIYAEPQYGGAVFVYRTDTVRYNFINDTTINIYYEN
jgi:hypothetical protein